jgi:predicted PurR-regulated permease PerM
MTRTKSGQPSEPVAHHPRVGQPHDAAAEGPIAQAEAVAATLRTPADPLGPLGRRLNWRSAFLIGLAATAGVAVTVGIIQMLLLAGQVLLLIALALFLAIGLEPAVSWLITHRFPRWAAVFTVLAGLTLLLAGFIAAAIPALVEQGRRLVEAAPQYVAQLSDDSSAIGQLNQRFHLQETVQQIVDGGGPGLASGVISVGEAVFGAFSGLLVVAVLTVYFLADMPRVRTTLYRFMPAPRRPRAILLGDQIMVKVGGYVLGNVVISVISAVVTFVWLIALLDLIPVIGSLIAGALVALAAFSVSVPVGLATIGYFVAYKLVEDYLLTPKVFGRVLRMPALVTVCAILIGGALLGLVGALVALPTAAAIMLLVQEVVFPRLDRARAGGEPAADPAA